MRGRLAVDPDLAVVVDGRLEEDGLALGFGGIVTLIRYQQKQTWPVDRRSLSVSGAITSHLPSSNSALFGPGLDVVGLVGLAVGGLAVDLDDLDVVIPPLSLDGRHAVLGSQVDFLGLRDRGLRTEGAGRNQSRGGQQLPHQITLPGCLSI